VTDATTEIEQSTKPGLYQKSLFQTAIGAKFDELPPCLQELHGPDAPIKWGGQARTQAGTTWLAKLISRSIGFGVPPEHRTATYESLEVTFERTENSEEWTRDFDGHRFKSHFTLEKKAEGDHVNYVAIENFGLFKFELDLLYEDNRLYFLVRRCTFLKLPLPAICLPKGDSYEFEREGRFHFCVEVRVPLAGLIAAYDGWLVPR